MRMIAPIALLAISTLKEIADLGLVDTLCDTKIGLAMCEIAVLIVAPARKEGPAELRLLEIWWQAEFRCGVRVSAIRRGTLATLEEGTHLGL